jgi:hypothetical protein
MFRKLTMIVPMAILLGAASAAPAAAQPGSHRLPNQARAYNAYALAPSALALSDAQSSAGCPRWRATPTVTPTAARPGPYTRPVSGVRFLLLLNTMPRRPPATSVRRAGHDARAWSAVLWLTAVAPRCEGARAIGTAR